MVSSGSTIVTVHQRSLPRLFAVLAATGLAVLLLGPAHASAARCEHANSSPSSTALRNIEKATVCLLNERRRKHGRPALDKNNKLRHAARPHSRDMDRRRFFSHTNPDGATPVRRVRKTGYLDGPGRWVVGENIAWGSGVRATPGSIVKAWMDSPSHRANILTASFRDLGVGVTRGAPKGGMKDAAIYTTDFGRN